MSTNTVLNNLNKLGPLYHSYFGIHPEEGSMQDFCPSAHFVDIDVEDNPEETLKKYFDDGCGAVDQKTDKFFGTFEELIKTPYVGKGFAMHYGRDEMMELSQTDIPYETVVIRFTDNTWYGELTEWYNKPSKQWNAIMSGKINSYLKPYALPYLKSRNYIHVDEPFMKVTVSANEKGIPLTYDDILFATRALCLDDTRTIDAYKIIEDLNDSYDMEDKTTLVLEPEIDNYSS